MIENKGYIKQLNKLDFVLKLITNIFKHQIIWKITIIGSISIITIYY